MRSDPGTKAQRLRPFLKYQVAHLAPVFQASANRYYSRKFGSHLGDSAKNHDGGPTIRVSIAGHGVYKALGVLFAGTSVSVASVFMRGNAS